MTLTNHTILITGGTSGIGLALGRMLLEKNNQVILLGRNQERLSEASRAGFEIISCDLTKISDIEAAAVLIQNKYPQLNLLFNNAGVQFNYHFAEQVIPPAKIAQEIQINVTGQIMLTQLLLPILANSPQAWIINTTSGLGMFPKEDGLVYSASKAAMRNFTIGLRMLLKETPIKVLELIPPVTDTPMTSKRGENKMSVQRLIELIVPQLEKERNIITVGSLRVFEWIAFLLPGLAHRMLSKGDKS